MNILAISRRRLAVPALLSAAILLAGCARTEDPQTEYLAANLPGHWQVWIRSGPVEIGPLPVFLPVQGKIILGAGIAGTIDGGQFRIAMVSPDGGTIAARGTLSDPESGSGTIETTDSGGNSTDGTFRMKKLAPIGTLQLSGGIGANDLTHESTSSIGALYRGPGSTTPDIVSVFSIAADRLVELRFSTTNMPAKGSAVVGTGANTVLAQIQFATLDGYGLGTASSGALTNVIFDETGFHANFSLRVGTNTLSGRISVAYDIEGQL